VSLRPSRSHQQSRSDELLARAVGLHQRGLIDDAAALYECVLAADKCNFDALHLLGVIQAQRGRPAEAVRLLSESVRIRPQAADAHVNLARVLAMLDRHEEALASLDRALALDASHVLALTNRGATLKALGRLHEAVATYDRALSIKPDYADALYNRGNALNLLQDYDDALASFDKALRIRPNHVGTWIGRATALRRLCRWDEAVAALDRALAQEPNSVLAHFNRANILSDSRRYEEAVVAYERVLALAPDHRYAHGGLVFGALATCDWRRSEPVATELATRVREDRSIVPPFSFLACSQDAALQRRCAEAFARDEIPAPPTPLWRGQAWHHDRVRIAYMSSDFRQHAMSHLIARLFELHDRSRFEVIGISLGADDGGPQRARIAAAVEQFHDVHTRSDLQIASLIRELEVDILIDLNGWSFGGRSGILAHRPAPIQMSYLGFPGTSGTSFVDYAIVDDIVLPADQQSSFSEKAIYLPDCYLVSGPTSVASDMVPNRAEVGLPDGAFVFCCFNNNYKIRPIMFDLWMRLLHKVEGSVLWLLADNAASERNLRQQAVARGVEPHRLVFAPRLPLADHLARHRLADLCLDTLPVNAHTTAADALWMEVPLVTCRGTSFVGRVAASVLNAVGLPELVTESLADYEALAARTAGDRTLAESLRAKLRNNRLVYPLFDTNRFRLHMEEAYRRACEIWQRGGAPESFRIAACAPCRPEI
jgi:protein O-GlcNAc transferase